MGKRTWGAALLALVGVLLTGTMPAQAKVRLDVRSVGERAVKVRVAAPKRAVRVSAMPAGVVRAKRVKLRGRTRTVKLRFTAFGRSAVESCSVRTLVVRVGRKRRTVSLAPCLPPQPAAPTAPRNETAAPAAAEPTPQPTPAEEPTPEPEPEPAPAPNAPPPATDAELLETPFATVPGCDFLDPSACLLPFPNDYFTTADASTDTGLRVDIAPQAMPRNVAGKPIDATDWNRSDGWSTGTPILTFFPGLSPAAFVNSGVVPQTDMARAFDPDQPVVVVDAETGERQPIWAELDQHAQTKRELRVLIIRPARNLEPGRRYIVAIRNLVGADHKPLPVTPRFRFYRDNVLTLNPAIEARRPSMERIFSDLARADVDRSELQLAWDFTTASRDDRVGRMLHIRDQAFAALGDTDLDDLQVQGDAPQFTIDSVTDFTPEQDANIARTVTGTVTVPCFLDKPACAPAGSRFLIDDATGMPTQIPGNTMSAPFVCNIPHAAAQSPARLSLYGHGLFGSASEVGAGNVDAMAAEHDIAFCATDWAGMATTDVPNVATILVDLSNFPTLADRVQQGILNFLYLGRLMIHPEGLAAQDAFKRDGAPLVDTEHLYYDGNSQGGIIGTALMGVTPDVQRGVLGVPGINYSTLLQRSVDFETNPDEPCPAPPDQLLGDLQEPELDPEYALELFNLSYACPLYAAYPNQRERQLVFALMQQLWDRGEGNGYAAFIREGIEGRVPPHEVLMHVALGDHQVAQVAAEVEARTIGAAIRPNPVDPDRTYDVEPAYGIEEIGGFPYEGSAIEIWDSGPVRPNPADCLNHGGGTEVAPATNRPPRCGRDPHGEPRSTALARRQKSAFLRPPGESAVIDVCSGGPCYARNWKGSF